MLIHPDQTALAVQTAAHYLILYNIRMDPSERVYRQIRTDDKARRLSVSGQQALQKARQGQRAVLLRFKMIIKIDAGMEKVVASDDEIVVATKRPAAVQCIRWSSSSQPPTDLVKNMPWMDKKDTIREMVYDRSTRMFIWTTVAGAAFFVLKLAENAPQSENQSKLFRGYQLHSPAEENDRAEVAAVNARFSLLSVGMADGQIHVYVARDYYGNLQPSHTLQPPVGLSTSGKLTCLRYSQDGYCLFAGYEYGWAMWSAYGKFGGSSFTADRDTCKEDNEHWLLGVQGADWINGGAQIIITTLRDSRMWVLDTARSSMTGWLGSANTSRMMLLTDLDIRIYRGQDAGNITALAMDASQWSHIQLPRYFLERQRPMRCAVLSADGRYLALAGRRGLAHYSVQSGRWKTFENIQAEEKFVVKGGMFWYHHILVAAVETEDGCEVGALVTHYLASADHTRSEAIHERLL